MGRGQADTRGNLLYGEPASLRSSAPTSAELEETLMRIAGCLRNPNLEFWDGTVTPHDIRRKYSRYDETARQQEVHLQRLMSKFRTLEADGMIELDHTGEEPAWHAYRLAAKGEEIGNRLLEEDYRAAVERNAALGETSRPEPTPAAVKGETEETCRRAEESRPEGVTSL